MEAYKLTAEERLRLDAQASRGLIWVVISQLIFLLAVSALFALFASWNHAYWSCIGGLAYLIPSAFVVLRMILRIFSGRMASFGGLFVAEGIKVFGTLVILWLVVRYFGNSIMWLPLLVGLIATMKSYFLLIVLNKF